MLRLSDLKKLTVAFENSDWDDVHLLSDGVEIHISTDGGAGTAMLTTSTTPTPTSTVTKSSPAAPPPASGSDTSPPPADAGVTSGTGTAVGAPTPGIFWAAPSPGAPPFIDVGQHVEPETTICIIEIMKLMTMVPAGVSGTVVSVLGRNGEPVEQGQSLILIDEGSGG